MIKSYQAVLLYLIVLFIYTCISYVAASGPNKLKYYNTKENGDFFDYNMTSFGKIMFSMYISQTRENFPDIMVKKWDGNEVMMALVFCSYMFIMYFIVMNVMAGIFYSNYKGTFESIIKGLKNQGYITRIVSVSLSKYGTIDFQI